MQRSVSRLTTYPQVAILNLSQLAVHYDGPGDQLPGTALGGYGWDVRTSGLTSTLAAEPGQEQGGEGGQPMFAVAP